MKAAILCNGINWTINKKHHWHPWLSGKASALYYVTESIGQLTLYIYIYRQPQRFAGSCALQSGGPFHQ